MFRFCAMLNFKSKDNLIESGDVKSRLCMPDLERIIATVFA